MIIKMSQRSGAKALAKHLLNTQDNEHVEIIALEGFIADNLTDALQEIHAQRLANKKIKSELVSISINPPIGKIARIDDFVDGADRAGKLLGLENQPRAIVQHSKEGRSHIHVVYSRIDENLKAIKLPFYKKKLNSLSKELYLEKGWELPKGFQNKNERSQTNYDLAEAHIAKRQKRDPKAIKVRIQALWEKHPSQADFIKAIEQESFRLALGDNKRAIVLVDIYGDVRSLSRTVGIKTKDVKAKIHNYATLPTIDVAKQSFLDIHKTQYIKRKDALIRHHDTHLDPHVKRIKALVEEQKAERRALEEKHELRQQRERNARQSQYQKGLKALFNFVLGKTRKLRKQHEAQYQQNLKRDATEKEQLIQRQLQAREKLQVPLNSLKNQHEQALQHFNTTFIKSIETLDYTKELTHAIKQEINIQPPQLEA